MVDARLRLERSDQEAVGRYPLALRQAVPGDLSMVSALVNEAAGWLRAAKGTDQWANPWPSRTGQRDRMLHDLLKGKTWIAWDGKTAAATITIDAEEPLTSGRRPVWPEHQRHEPALYLRRIVVSRGYAARGLGAALMDWAAEMAQAEYGAKLLRIDVWTTNLELHAYYEGQGFTRCAGRNPRELAGYPSQALFERDAKRRGTSFAQLLIADSLPRQADWSARRPH